jgi:thiopeptide-type bacteriocin biosynthesis protein
MSAREATNRHAASGFFAVRTPLLPFDELLAWGEGLEAPAAVGDVARLERAVALDRARLRERLRALIQRPEVREALFVASPDLDERFPVWLRQPDSDAGRKLELTLVRYLQRMAGRATPFGLCAGCSVGTLGRETRLELAGRNRSVRHARLDTGYLTALADALHGRPELRRTLAYRPNASLYRAAGRLRYTLVRHDGKDSSYLTVGIEASAYLDTILAQARDGADPPALAQALLDAEPDAARAEAEDYIGELIDSQVLVAGLAPALTGREPIHGLTALLRGRATMMPVVEQLEQVQGELDALNAAEPGASPERYRRIAERLAELPGKVELPRLFQVDLVKPADATLGLGPVAEIERGVEILRRQARPDAEDKLRRFRERFLERYQGQEGADEPRCWVPLLEALDDEVGIGFEAGPESEPSALLEGVELPTRAEEKVTWGRREQVLLRRLSEALARGAPEIKLTPQDLEELAVTEPLPLPDAFAVQATLAAASPAALAEGDFRVWLQGVAGPSGACLLGRFCHADAELRRHVEEHLRAEEALQPDALFAEIVHLPENGRMGNILARPALRAYEIPYLAQSGVPAERQIPVSDLLVSVAGNRVFLRSARLGRQVIPRLTSAHNFKRGQPVYRFLCMLQAQAVARLGWDWGPLADAPFLPRVTAGRLVLARAEWRVSRDELQRLGKAKGAEQFAAVQAWRAERRLPRRVLLVDYDNTLPVDLDNVLSVETFVDLVKGRERATLAEMFPGPDELCAHGPEGRFVHELVVPFVRALAQSFDSPLPSPPLRGRGVGGEGVESSANAPGSPQPIARRFPPGSDWLYAKLYCGCVTADQLLRDVVRPVSQAALRSGAANGWFFIRYGDPEWHLRVRFHGDPDRLRAAVLPALQSAAAGFLKDGRVWRMQLDTYEREVERYGGARGIVVAERLFQVESEATLALLDLLAEDARGDLRWRLALLGIDRFLGDLDFDWRTRRDLLARMRTAFAREFRVDAKAKGQLGDRYRKERKELESLLDESGVEAEILRQGLIVLRQRSQHLAAVVAELRARERAGTLSLSLAEMVPSYVHMQMNRLLQSAARVHELVLYDFLARYYETRVARAAEASNGRGAVVASIRS